LGFLKRANIDRLLPQIDLDLSPLYSEADRIESRLKAIREQAKPVEKSMPPALYA